MSIDSLKDFYNSYRTEVLIVSLSLSIVFISLIFFILQSPVKSEEPQVSHESLSEKVESESSVVVDLAGAVNKPDVYEMKAHDRLNDLIERAGGLSEDADTLYFSRQFNLASKLVDQQKIYIPSITEVANGEMDEISNDKNQISNLPSDRQGQIQNSTDSISHIDINNATVEELDTLPGVGKTTADKIISGRPYTSVEEILTRKIIGQSLYEKIKEKIGVN